MSTGRQPDILTVGHTARLVSLEGLAEELRVPSNQARALAANLGVPLVRIGSKEYLNLLALEIELWVATRPERVPIPDDLESFTKAIQDLGYIYAGLTREAVRRRLSRVLAPLRPERRGQGRHRSEDATRGRASNCVNAHKGLYPETTPNADSPDQR